MRIGEQTMRAMNSERIASHTEDSAVDAAAAAAAAYSRAHIDCMTNCHLNARYANCMRGTVRAYEWPFLMTLNGPRVYILCIKCRHVYIC